MFDMQVNVKNLVSMTEANQNFSKVAKLVDENGAVVVLRNNKPKYVILEYSQIQDERLVDSDTVENVAKEIIARHLDAFMELAK